MNFYIKKGLVLIICAILAVLGHFQEIPST